MSNGRPPLSGFTHPGGRRNALRKFLYMGLGVKRWLLVGSAGVGVCSVGLAFVIKNIFDLSLPNFLPWYFEGVVIAVAGVTVILLAAYGLYRSIGPLLLPSPGVGSLADTIYSRRYRDRGLRVVAIGGGTGLSVLLRGLKSHTDNISAIVTVADDGGSSGRLREQLGVLPPGDFRNCLVAMSDAEALVHELFQHRFKKGEGLEGHSFGNLFIAAMTDVTGSFDKAILESSRVLAVRGSVIPATMGNITLSARMVDGSYVSGESSIASNGAPIERVMIEPADAEAHQPALEAIADAQLVLIGPGSLYTSILPNLLVRGISSALRETDAAKMYIANVANERGETEGYTLSDHVRVLRAHTFPAIADYVIANEQPPEAGGGDHSDPVRIGDSGVGHARLVTDYLADPSHPARHDSSKLAEVIMDVYHGTRGGLRGVWRVLARR